MIWCCCFCFLVVVVVVAVLAVFVIGNSLHQQAARTQKTGTAAVPCKANFDRKPVPLLLIGVKMERPDRSGLLGCVLIGQAC
jgi:cytochrome bd-type quinol oxidase subunit 1